MHIVICDYNLYKMLQYVGTIFLGAHTAHQVRKAMGSNPHVWYGVSIYLGGHTAHFVPTYMDTNPLKLRHKIIIKAKTRDEVSSKIINGR